MKKGQNFRVFIGGKCISASKSCTIEETAELEDISTKDSTDMAKESEVKGKSWSGSADSLVFNGVDSNAVQLSEFLSTIIAGQPVAVKFTETSGNQNREVKEDAEVTYTGNAIINDVTVKATVNETISVSVKFIGYGKLTKTSKDVE